MSALRHALVTSAVIVLLGVVLGWSGSQAAMRYQPGVELALPWRLALFAETSYIAYLPFVAVLGIPLAALVGAWRGASTTIREERRGLLAWIIVAALEEPALLALLYVPGLSLKNPALPVIAVVVGLGIAAHLAAGIVGVHLQSRRRAAGAQIAGWHVAVATVLLALLGPAMLLPPAFVWWTTRTAA